MSSGNQSSSSCCPPGSVGTPQVCPNWEGTPQGIYLTLGDDSSKTPCYYIGPSENSYAATSRSSNALIAYTDVWGLQSRITLLCDFLAKQIPGGLHVLVLDCFRGETKDHHPNDMIDWFRQTPWDPIVQQDTTVCMEFLKQEKNVTDFAAMGFCWGVWALAKASQAGIPWKAVVSPHPSFKVEAVAFGGDDVALMQGIQCPTLLMPAGNDPDFTKAHSEEFQELVKRQPGSLSKEFPEMVHGWTTRSDLTNGKTKRDLDSAMDATVAFLTKHLPDAS